MAEIRRLGFDALVREVSQDRPFLGICVGMQALLERSEENDGSTASVCSPARCASSARTCTKPAST